MLILALDRPAVVARDLYHGIFLVWMPMHSWLLSRAVQQIIPSTACKLLIDLAYRIRF